MKQNLEDMMFKSEADLTKHVKKYLESLKPTGSFRKISDRFHPGVSDFIGCYKGKFVAIELKAEDGQPTMHQLEYIFDIINAGGYGIVARTLSEVKNLINSIQA